MHLKGFTSFPDNGSVKEVLLWLHFAEKETEILSGLPSVTAVSAAPGLDSNSGALPPAVSTSTLRCLI